MDLVSSVSLFVVPRWVKIIVLTLLALLGAIYLALSLFGISIPRAPGGSRQARICSARSCLSC